MKVIHFDHPERCFAARVETASHGMFVLNHNGDWWWGWACGKDCGYIQPGPVIKDRATHRYASKEEVLREIELFVS
jgi:VCBS repeat-containing protein